MKTKKVCKEVRTTAIADCHPVVVCVVDRDKRKDKRK